MIVGFGSAHIDILATVTGDPKTKDRIGKIAMDIGGTGGNVAINCASLDVPTRFVTALNGSAHSRIIEEHLEMLDEIEDSIRQCMTKEEAETLFMLLGKIDCVLEMEAGK